MNIIKTEIPVFEEGNTHNPSVIFVHGFPFDHQMWKYVINNFDGAVHSVAYDIKGLGLTEPGDGQFTIEDLADDLLSIIEKLNLDKPFLCGLSMGGYISLRAIQKAENKFRGLILCDTKSASDNDETKIKRAQGIQKINKDGVQKFAEEFVKNCFAEESIENLGEEYIAILGRSMNSNPIGVKGCLLAMAAKTDTTSYLPQIKIPVLVLCGEKDKLTPPEVMRDMAGKIKGAEFHIVPGSGHMSPVENSSFVCEKIREFVINN